RRRRIGRPRPLQHAPPEQPREDRKPNQARWAQARRGERDQQQNRGENPVHAPSITGTSIAAGRCTASSRLPQEKYMGATPRNEGEGSKSADRNYREATRKFVESERGRREIDKAGDVTAEQEREIKRAEEKGKARAKEHDREEGEP